MDIYIIEYETGINAFDDYDDTIFSTNNHFFISKEQVVDYLEEKGYKHLEDNEFVLFNDYFAKIKKLKEFK